MTEPDRQPSRLSAGQRRRAGVGASADSAPTGALRVFDVLLLRYVVVIHAISFTGHDAPANDKLLHFRGTSAAPTRYGLMECSSEGGNPVVGVERWSGNEAKALRQAMRLSVRAFAEHLGVAVRTVSKWEATGDGVRPRPDMQAVLDTALEQVDEQTHARFAGLLGDDRATIQLAENGVRPLVTRPPTTSGVSSNAALRQVEGLRRAITVAISDHALPTASLDDWERTALRQGAATRDRPASLLLGDLAADLAELYRVIADARSVASIRSLTRTAAKMAGLVCLTLIKLDQRASFRRWAQTARVAASNAGDPWTHSWVLAQEAYGFYYSGDLTEAIDVARHAQGLVRAAPCVGSVLATALEARAQASLGRLQETMDALGRAEDGLSRLEPSSTIASAFGYTEAQLRFHEENALTHLGATDRAWKAQERALELCPSHDYMDRTLARLDRASCLACDGHVSDAMNYATQTLTSLTDQQREGIIALRSSEVVNAVPERDRDQPPVRNFRDLLISLEGAPQRDRSKTGRAG